MGLQRVLTREEARGFASRWADDPSTVAELVHEGFNGDLVSGGFAFRCDRGLCFVAFDATRSWSVEQPELGGPLAQLEQFWAESRHRHRPLALADQSVPLRAAIAALVGGLASVRELPADQLGELLREPIAGGSRERRRPRDADATAPAGDPSARPGHASAAAGDPLASGDDALAHADYLLVHLARHAAEPTETAALKALAANDWLRTARGGPGQTAHPCPICGRPAIGGPRYLTAVCDTCRPLTRCAHERQISGHNLSLSGGFEASHVDDDSVCDQATADHRCWINAQECRIDEAYMGGVVVTADR